MRSVSVVVVLCLVAMVSTATAQVESACVLTVASSKITNLDDTKVQAAIKSSVTTIAGDYQVVFHKGTNEAAVLLCPSDACDAMPDALEGVLPKKIFGNVSVNAKFERFVIGARSCSSNYSCPWYWWNCTTRTSRGRNSCVCPNSSCWGK